MPRQATINDILVTRRGSKEYHAAEAARIAGELAGLGPDYDGDGIVKTVLRERIEQEELLAEHGCGGCVYCDSAGRR